jgi:hypothetical protein
MEDPKLYTAELLIPHPGDAEVEHAFFAWMAAIKAAGTPPLWVRLLDVALTGGWTEADSIERAFRAGIHAAAALSDAVFAPASDRIRWSERNYPSYTTCAGTTITIVEEAFDKPLVIEIIGQDPSSVLRRALAAAESTNIRWTPDTELREAALARERELAVLRAESKLASDIAVSEHRGMSYLPADDTSTRPSRSFGATSPSIRRTPRAGSIRVPSV